MRSNTMIRRLGTVVLAAGLVGAGGVGAADAQQQGMSDMMHEGGMSMRQKEWV